MDYTISEVLRGTKVGNLQSVGVMQIIPLICKDKELYDLNIISPQDKDVETSLSTHNYGEMKFRNPDPEKVLLIPCHAGYVTKHAAQDHAMSRAGLVGKGDKSFDDAMCIQQSQGGYIPEGQHDMLVLPFSLRESAFNKRGERSYYKLWDDISRFNASFEVSATGNLDNFLSAFRDELDQFVAEFEIVPKQIGAIILINGSVTGVERAPNPRYWSELWRPLVRECYGSLSIEVARKNSRTPTSRLRVPLKSRGLGSLEDLEREIERAEAEEDKRVREIVRELLDDPFSDKVEDTMNGYDIVSLENDQFNGQVLRKSRSIVYASMFTKAKWAKDAPWNRASKFAI